MKTGKQHFVYYMIATLLTVLVFTGGLDAKESKNMELSAEKMFKDSQGLFDEGQFWNCSGNLILILDTYPQYTEIDKVIYMLGECLYETEMLQASLRLFDFFLTSHADSDYLPKVLASMQRIYFDNKEYLKSLEIHKTLLAAKPDQQIVNYSLYYAGLANYYDQKYDTAITAFQQIDESSPYWDNARYNVGLSYLKTEQIRLGIDQFQSICRLPVYTPERQNLLNETHLTLGYLYYEMGRYEHALKEFKRVTTEYPDYKTVLLSSGWAATKMGDYKEAILHLTDFITLFPENNDTPQGLFLLGRCYLRLGLYQEALESYDYLTEILPKNSILSDSINTIQLFITEQSDDIEKIKMDILMLESKFINELSLDADGEVPEYILEQKNDLLTQRQQLLEHIKNERQVLATLQEKIKIILEIAEVKDEQREWRAYAEYGKSRALFLAKQDVLP